MRSINIENLAPPNSFTRAALVDALVLMSFYLTIVSAYILPFPLYKQDLMKILILITVVRPIEGILWELQ